jgi:uncharacterized repeat protein (TIGR01451 family)
VIGIPRSSNLISSGLAAVAFILMFLCVAQAAYPPEADLSIFEEARIAGSATSEVDPGEVFDYVITVSNNNPAINASDVVVTDKLPYDVAFLSINASPNLGSYSIQRSGDLIYVRFAEVPANTTGSITVSVSAPTEAPTTLYNMVSIRYGNDPNQSNNRMTIETYVPLIGYDQLVSGGADRISPTASSGIENDCGC